MPTKEALEAQYKAVSSKADLAPIFGVSPKTIERWFQRLGIKARAATGASVAGDRRKGGRRYKRNGKRPQHVAPSLARRMRELKRDNPGWSAAKVLEESGATCTRQMVALVLAGKRCTSPESFPPPREAPAPVPAARLTFGRVPDRDG